MESIQARLLPALELIAPTLTILVLLWIGDKEPPEIFYDHLKKDRANVQILVQVFSHVLAGLQVSSLCATFNLSTRFRFLRRSTSLNHLSFWTAISTARVDPSLPRLHYALALSFVLATLIPGALWAGALSPLFVSKIKNLDDVYLPAYSDATKVIWDSQFQERGHQVWNINDDCSVINDANGLIPSCPVPTLQGLLLLSASAATTLDGWPRRHSKLDNPSWEYIGRSFGVGSSIGQANHRLSAERVLLYSYTELGYNTEVSCIQNSTSDIYFRLRTYTNQNISAVEYQTTHHPELNVDPSLPPIQTELSYYYVEGYLPNSLMGSPHLYPVISWHQNYENLTAWASEGREGRNIIAIAAGANLYQQLNQTQCEIIFTPTLFNVTVNRSKQTITVSPQHSTKAQRLEPTGHLERNVVRSINLLARMSPSLYVSVLGETLNRNVARTQIQKPHLTSKQAVTSAIADSFTAIADDILVAYGSSQISNAHSTTSSPVIGAVKTVQIGQSLYRNLIFFLNSTIILIVAFEALNTGFWHRLTKFNYLDIKSVIVASSAGGGGVAESVLENHRERGTDWVADSSDPIACKTQVEWNLSHVLDDTETMAIVTSRSNRRRDQRSRMAFRLNRLD